MPFTVNTRILQSHTTGVQRYLLELLARMPEMKCISPKRRMAGIRGHAWEQLHLPTLSRGVLLWSPSNTGPLAVSRQVVTIHDVVPLDHPEWLNPRFATWYRFLTPRLARRVSRVIADSEFTKTRLLERTGIPDEKVTVVMLGVDQRFAPQDSEHIEYAVQNLSLPSKHYILSIGSLEPRKNLGRLLRAWETVYRRLPDDVWLVVSGAKGKSLVFQDVPELKALPPRVFLTGHVDDALLPALYAGALAFAYLSVYEGFGLPPLEAMACGTPAMVGNLASLPEVVGDAAVQVNPYDIEAIADGLLRLVGDNALREDLAQRGLERARQFSWDRTAEQTLRVLDEAARE